MQSSRLPAQVLRKHSLRQVSIEKNLHSLKVENYVLFGRLTEPRKAAFQIPLRDLFQRGQERSLGLPWWLSRKESTCNAGVAGSIPGLRRFLWRRGWQSTPVFLPGKTDGQRSLVGYSLWGSKRVRHDFASKDIHTWRRKQYRNHPYSHHLKRQSRASSLPLEVHTPHTRTVSASQPVLPPSQTSLPLPSPVWVPLLSLPVSPVPSQLLPSSRQTSTS